MTLCKPKVKIRRVQNHAIYFGRVAFIIGCYPRKRVAHWIPLGPVHQISLRDALRYYGIILGHLE